MYPSSTNVGLVCWHTYIVLDEPSSNRATMQAILCDIVCMWSALNEYILQRLILYSVVWVLHQSWFIHADRSKSEICLGAPSDVKPFKSTYEKCDLLVLYAMIYWYR